MSKDFYVYAHYTLDTNELFYIGKGKGKRADDKRQRNRFWNFIVDKHGFYSKKLIENLEESDALIQELLAIKEMKPKANLSKGGVGGFTGLNSGNFKKGHRPWNTGKVCPEISQRQRGSEGSMWGKPNPKRKPIICQNDQREFSCLLHAAIFYGITRSNISSVLTGNTYTVRGLVFTYKEDYLANTKALKRRLLRKNKQRKSSKKVKCIETEIIYDNLTICCKNLNLQKGNVVNVIKGKRKSTGGFSFEYL